MHIFIRLLILFYLLGGILLAQTPTNQDCSGSIAVCQDIYFQANSFSGSGNYPNEINGGISCLFTGEFNSVWYTFTVQTSGNLCFTIIPNNSADDYDWAVYNLTNSDCSDIATDQSLEVSCNYDPIGVSAQTGPNGMAGLGFEPCIPVNAGETYAVNLSNFTASADGYTLDLSASTATIFDGIAPEMDSVIMPIDCGTNSIDIQFSENILCSSISSGDFLLTGPGGNHTITSIDGAVCAAGGSQENLYTLTISPSITMMGTYSLELTNTSGLVEDLCGNTASPAILNFTPTFTPVSAGLGDSLLLCSADAPVNLFTVLSANPDNTGIWIDPSSIPVSGTYDPSIDPTGIYAYVVGVPPCPTDTAFVVVDTVTPPSAGSNGTLVVCDANPVSLIGSLSGNPSPGGTWTDPNGLAHSGFFDASTDPIGTYTYQVSGIGSCLGGSANVSVSINPFANAGANGTTSVCETDAPFDLFSILTNNPDFGGSWTDPSGNPSANIFTPGISTPGAYTYTVSAVAPCPDLSAIVTVSVSSAPEAGNNAFLTVCTSDLPFNLLTGLGGTPDLGGQWTDFLGNPVANVFDPSSGTGGPYTYTVSGTPPCPSTNATLVITINPAPTLSLSSQQNLTCNGDSSGVITVSASGGLLPYEYSIDGGGFVNSPTFSGLDAGSHTLLVRDANGCTDDLTSILTEPAPLSGSISTFNNVNCNGGSDGSVTIQASGGTIPYQYSLDGINFFTSGTFNGLTNGNYFATVEDANGCQTTVNISITQPEPLVAVFANSSTILCTGDSTASFSVQGGGGIGPYQYSLDGITYTSNNTFSGLPAGSYLVFIQDANTCISSFTHIITEPPVLTLSVSNQTDTDCLGGMNGTISGTAAGGTNPYQFSIDGVNFGTNATFSGLQVGFYTLTVQDINGCIAHVDTSVSSPTGLLASVDSLVNISCAGGTDGYIELLAQGATSPYQYSLDGVNFSANPVFSGLAAGSYTATIQDANGCTVTVGFALGEPSPLNISITNQTNIGCNGDTTGSITVSSTGGVGTYEYAINSSAFSTVPMFTGLAAGNYLITVRDTNLCIATTSTILTEPSALLIDLDTLIDVACFSEATGLVEVEGAGGTQPYAFEMIGGSFGTSDSFPNLQAGNYGFVIQDANLCTDTLLVVVNQPDTLVGNITSQLHVACAGDSTGVISINTIGGSNPYLYSLDGVNFSPNNTFNALPSGGYTASIQDANGCTDTVQFFISEPPGLNVQVVEQSNVDCNGQSTGAIHLSSTGGVGPYIFSVNGGTTQTDSSFTNLPTGNYTFVVEDSNGCTDSLSLTITEPQPLAASIDSLLNVDCFGSSTGFVSIQSSGGTVPYSYSINNGPFGPDSSFSGLIAGTYQIIIEDDSACQTTVSVPITEPTVLALQPVSQTDITCFGDSTGEIEVVGVGGISPYSYSIDSVNFQLSPIFTGLPFGTYQLTVRDSLNCSANLSVSLQQADSITIEFSNQIDASCFGFADGSILATAQGGTMPYQYSLDAGPLQGMGNFTGLSAGIHVVMVQDNLGCQQDYSFETMHPDTLISQLGALSEVDCYGNASGSFNILPIGGTPPYQYSLDGINFQQQASFKNLIAGIYDVQVVDDNGCQAMQELVMTEPDSLLLLTSGTDVLCHGDATGTASVEITGGTAPFQIVWDDPFAQITGSINGLEYGLYTVTILDANGCVAQDTQRIAQPANLSLSLLGVEDAFCDQANGSAIVEASGGVGEYLILWNSMPNQQGEIIEDVSGGSYLAILRDDNACFDSLTVEIGNIPTAHASFRIDPPTDTILLSRATLSFLNESEGAVAYKWDFGDGAGISDMANPRYQFADTGIYEITLSAYNEVFTCPDDTSMRIVVIPDGQLYFPTAFSPNGDGLNDTFIIKGEGIVSYEIIFFNRWGREIRRYSSYGEAWDGLTQNGSLAPEGVYVYAVKAVLNSGYRIEKGGSVTLIR